MLNKEDFKLLFEMKRNSYLDSIQSVKEVDIDDCVNKILTKMYDDLTAKSYRYIPSVYKIRLFDHMHIPCEYLTDFHDMTLNLPYKDKTEADKDLILYKIIVKLKKECDIIATEGTDAFDNPNIWIPTDQFKSKDKDLPCFRKESDVPQLYKSLIKE